MCLMYGRIDLSTPNARKRIRWKKFVWKGAVVSAIPLIFETIIDLPDGRLEGEPGDFLVRGPKRAHYQVVKGWEFSKESVWIDEFSSN